VSLRVSGNRHRWGRRMIRVADECCGLEGESGSCASSSKLARLVPDVKTLGHESLLSFVELMAPVHELIC
jgi:hypothetical protein